MLPTIEPELNEVERQVSHLRIDFERFFSGDLKLMPQPARRRLDRVFRRLWGLEVERAVDRFRLQALQDRYTSMSELWDKRLRAREEGRRLAPSEAPGRAVAPSDAAATLAPSLKAPGDAGTPAPVKARHRPDLRPLFERYQAARRELGEDPGKMSYERFEELVRQKAEEIRTRTGSTKLIFEVRTEGGKVRLVGRSAVGKG
jgi:hypothetical protein